MTSDVAGALFVYGTLRFDVVVDALLGRVPTITPAAVGGWRAAALPGRSYPGLVPARPGDVCSGRCLSGLTRAERELLDLFEGDPYEARELTLVGGGSVVAYLWRDVTDVRTSDWDPDRFAAEHLAGFVRRCRLWRDQVVPGPPR
ncbi:gamma-glutamylcyclotransferase [Frankia sp. Mgl5]|uniref:gamma-glutamylcyclotransferase family protein n=1 Tax=Frankia sp. Mgl5 TaxID=2933793 RepID=UPI0020103D91|nr:gamma-glutamylcyclotransferase [Frankia sp. Mgl5]